MDPIDVNDFTIDCLKPGFVRADAGRSGFDFSVIDVNTTDGKKLYIQCGKFTTDYGISRSEKYKTLTLGLDLLRSECGEKLTQVFKDILDWSVDIIYNKMVKGEKIKGMGEARDDNNQISKFLIKQKFNKQFNAKYSPDNKIIEKRKFVNLIEWDGEIKTKFTRPMKGANGEVDLVPIDPKALMGKSFDFFPILYCKKTFIGQNSSVQWVLSSAIVTRISSSGSVAPKTMALASKLLAEASTSEFDLSVGDDAGSPPVPTSTPVESVPEWVNQHTTTAPPTANDSGGDDDVNGEPAPPPPPTTTTKRVLGRFKSTPSN